jgi:hypothetical protein
MTNSKKTIQAKEDNTVKVEICSDTLVEDMSR